MQRFVPCADEVGHLQRAKTPAAKLFQVFCEEGHYKGRTQPTGTRQGIYAVTPSGKLLGSWNSRQIGYVKKKMLAALAAWDALEESERYPEGGVGTGRRAEDLYPKDGLSLLVFTRDLPREDDERPDDWRKEAWNIDHLWLSADEAQALAGGALPEAAARRLVRHHGRDNVRGQSAHYPDKMVQEARLTATKGLQDGGLQFLLLEGTGSVTETRKRSIGDGHDEPALHTRTFSGTMHGRATWNGSRFTEFQLAWVGDRTGATKYNERADDLGPAPMAVVFVLAPEGDRVAPSRFWDYRWRR